MSYGLFNVGGDSVETGTAGDRDQRSLAEDAGVP
jgi:hypothetical protein